MRKLTIEDFLTKAKEKHGNKYDYSKVVYVNGRSKVLIGCPVHGYFKQTPNSHLSGRGCAKCRYDSQKLTQEEFKTRATEIHKGKYTYDKVIYVQCMEKVLIGCPEHGSFWQTPNSHLSGGGCFKCMYDSKRVTIEEFITRANKTHGGKYDYSKVVYEKNDKKVLIGCPEHGYFEQTPSSHLSGSGCGKCWAESYRVVQEEFITRATKIHQGKYDYSKVVYMNANKKVLIGCPEHDYFEQTPQNHLNGRGCSKCSLENRTSTPEEFITKASRIHKDKYIYDKVVYKRTHKKVLIGCPEHGYFEQTPSSHLSGNGCPNCFKVFNGAWRIRNLEMKKLYLNQMPDCMKTLPCFIYYVKLEKNGEWIYKIGVSTNMKRRMKQIQKNSSYTIMVLWVEESTIYECATKEIAIMEKYMKFAYTRNTKFDGWTECFFKDVLEKDVARIAA